MRKRGIELWVVGDNKALLLFVCDHIIMSQCNPLSDSDIKCAKYPNCHNCECLTSYTVDASNVCDKENGTCPCTEGYSGKQCNDCEVGFFGYPNCKGL